jgi:tRNA-dihydrouridine synthase
MKNNPRMKIPVFGNGDVDSPERAIEMRDRYGVDGVMIGRASIGNPWIFREIKEYVRGKEKMEGWNNGIMEKVNSGLPTFQYSNIPISERAEVCRTHLQKSIEWKGPVLGILEMRRHYANYFKGLAYFKDFRMRLVTTDSFEEINSILDEVEEQYADSVIAA